MEEENKNPAEETPQTEIPTTPTPPEGAEAGAGTGEAPKEGEGWEAGA